MSAAKVHGRTARTCPGNSHPFPRPAISFNSGMRIAGEGHPIGGFGLNHGAGAHSSPGSAGRSGANLLALNSARIIATVH